MLLNLRASALKNNPEFVLETVKLDGGALEFASDDLRDNKKIVLEAVKNDYECFEFIGDVCKNDTRNYYRGSFTCKYL